MDVEANAQSDVVQRLARMIRDAEDRARAGSRLLPTGWGPVDQALGGLSLAGVHEFVGPVELGATDAASFCVRAESVGPSHGHANSGVSVAPLPDEAQEARLQTTQPWHPADGRCDGSDTHGRDARDTGPVCLLVHLARQAAGALGGYVVWIGRRSWPNPILLARAGLLERSLLVDAVDPGDRLWAVDLAIRCPAAACVVADAGGFKMPATRRLELAAGKGQGLLLLARTGSERATPSAAMTRWLVRRRVSESLLPAWTLELSRCKGMQSVHGGQGTPTAIHGGWGARWPLEWDCATGAVIVPAAVVDRLPAPAPVAERRSAGG